MKSLLGLAAAAMLVLGSCATSNEVNGGGVFQKRKYTKGFYWNKGTSANESASVLKSEKLKPDEVNSFNTFDTEKSSEDAINSSALNSAQSPNLVQKTEKVVAISKKQNVNSLSDSKDFVRNINPIKKMSHLESKISQKTAAKVKSPGSEGDLGYILGIILIVVLIILLLSLLDSLLFKGIIGTILAILIIVLILRWLGVF